MKLNFEKWHGAKNDFILTWFYGDDVAFDSLARQAPLLCNRDGSGIAADGILVLHVNQREQIYPDKLSIINSDGSIAETCGNGIRCTALSVLKRHREIAPRDIAEGFELPLKSSTVSCRFLGRGKLEGRDYWPLVSVDMGVPQVNSESPVYDDAVRDVDTIAKELKLPELTRDWAFVAIGNQHLVFFLDDANTQLLRKVGPALQNCKSWDGINVHLAVAKEPSNQDRTTSANKLGQPIQELYEVYVWERGAGETQACGSGACAVAAAALASGLVDRNHWLGIQMPGGRLYVKQDDPGSAVNLAGPAEFVFEGTVEI